MKVLDLFEAVETAKLEPVLATDGGNGVITVSTKAKAGPTLDVIGTVFQAFSKKKDVTMKSASGRPLDFNTMFRNRPGKIVLIFKDAEGAKEKVEAAIEAAVKSVEKHLVAKAKHKASAPERKKEDSKFRAELRKKDLEEYAKKYGKGTWNRVTYRQEGGDDGYSYVVRVDGRSKWNGLTQREATHYKEREVDEIAKREKLGKYAEKK